MPDSVGGMHTILLHGVVSASQLRLSAPASLVGANAPCAFYFHPRAALLHRSG